MKRLLLTALPALAALASLGAAPTIDPASVTLTPSAEGDRVEIAYALTGTNAIVTLDIQTNADATAEWLSIGAKHVRSLAGDVNKVVSPGNARKIVWMPDLDWPKESVAAGRARAVLTAWNLASPPPYMSVDLGGGAPCRRFYASADAIPGDISDTHHPCRHSRLLMRRIPAAGRTFLMGAVRQDAKQAASETPRLVTLSEDYYMAVFETTTSQYGYGKWAGRENDAPAVNVSYNALRGTTCQWPQDGHAVAADSAIGLLRANTGIASFDLPTEAQWEYACRGGYFHCFNNGTMSQYVAVCWCTETSGNRVKDVGRNTPNEWGLYDMHGNICEWCLDWFGTYDATDTVDPAGPTSGTKRVKRGGAYLVSYTSCRASARDSDAPTFEHGAGGFRLCCGIDVNDYK